MFSAPREARRDAMHHQLPGTARDLVVSYRALRRAIGTVGLVLPLVLGPGGWMLGIETQDSLSAYYHTPLRDGFVGALFALGALLVCYRGYTPVEAWTANLAAGAAFCLALFPLDPASDPLQQDSIAGYLHTLSGGAFFLVLSFYSLYLFPRSGTEARDRERRWIYWSTGAVLLGSVVTMGGLILLMQGERRDTINRWNLLFWLEWIAVWAFAAAWLTKGRAIVTEIAARLIAWPLDVLEERRTARR